MITRGEDSALWRRNSSSGGGALEKCPPQTSRVRVGDKRGTCFSLARSTLVVVLFTTVVFGLLTKPLLLLLLVERADQTLLCIVKERMASVMR